MDDLSIISGRLRKIVELIGSADLEALKLELLDSSGKVNLNFNHPHYSDTHTVPVASQVYGNCNFIYYRTTCGKHRWILMQYTNFIDAIITEDGRSAFSFTSTPVLVGRVSRRFLRNAYDPALFQKMPSSPSVWIRHDRPYHFFYDQFINIGYFLAGGMRISHHSFSETFFDPRPLIDNNKISTDSCIKLLPCLVGANRMFARQNQIFLRAADEMEKSIISAVTEQRPMNKRPMNSGISLWYGITAKKRSWIEQVEGARVLVDRLLEIGFSDITVYVDGLTKVESPFKGAEDFSIDVDLSQDMKVYEDIRSVLKGRCKLFCLIGKTYREKVRIASECGFFVANAGTGCLVPLRIARIPGVLHSNKTLFAFPGEYPGVYMPEANQIVEIEEGVKHDYVSYSIDPKVIADLAVCAVIFRFISSCREENVERIFSKTVGGENKPRRATEGTASDWFKTLPGRVSHGRPADVLREVAITFEKSGDMFSAYQVMKAAAELRPHGPIIDEKMRTYHAALVEAPTNHRRRS